MISIGHCCTRGHAPPFVGWRGPSVEGRFPMQRLSAIAQGKEDWNISDRFTNRCALLAACAALLMLPATAYASDASESSAAMVARPTNQPAATMEGRVFEPSYFERFAPRNALDMLQQVPGFLLQGGGGGGNGRGFGQANENVLVNGQRLSSKSDSAQDQLRRIPASKVIRIEIVDGTALDIPGLTGQVANVLIDSGEISIAGSSGALDFTLAVENNNNRFGSRGPTVFLDGDGVLLERQAATSTSAFDYPQISASLGYDFGNGTIANLNGFWRHTFFDRVQTEDRVLADGTQIDRISTRRGSTPDHEISADVTFPLGAGRLKLIGLDAYNAEENINIVIDTDLIDQSDTGTRFTQTGGSGERIGRFEYNWPMLGGDWQLAGEAAFNRLTQFSSLFDLNSEGSFIELEFPQGTGGVTEDRYEAILSYSRQITGKLAIQASIGGEYSKIQQTGSAANSRSFQRPKGAASLAWQPEDGLDISLGVERRVGQLSFSDFLAGLDLDEDNADAGNNQLVPSQTWEAVLEISKTLGPWGTTTVLFEKRWIDDFTDIVPLPGGGESRGNIASARRTEIEWTTTLQLDAAGWRGAQLDIRLEYEEGEVRDPVTSRLRDFSGGRDRELEIDFRHDISGSDYAYGGSYAYNRNRPRFRVSEISLEEDTPNSASVFVEHKDILGMTVNLSATNLLGSRETVFRTIFDGPRSDGNVLFTEDRSFRIGPIFRFNVSGNF